MKSTTPFTILHLTLLAAPLSTSAKSFHTIQVGPPNTFTPSTLTPAVNDTIIFVLHSTHNVIRGNFANPCQPIDFGGFYSGPYEDTDDGRKRFVVDVRSTETVWFYCSVGHHCQSGMVGGWNVPESGDTVEAYAAASRDVEDAGTPDQLKGGELMDEDQVSSLLLIASSTSQQSSTSEVSSASKAATTTSHAERTIFSSESPSPSGSEVKEPATTSYAGTTTTASSESSGVTGSGVAATSSPTGAAMGIGKGVGEVKGALVAVLGYAVGFL